MNILVPLLSAASLALTAPQNLCTKKDTADVAQFFSHFINALPSSERVPRGAFVLVCGDHIAFASGFGNALNGQPVNPERTLFRAALNSKLVAATAAMQLAATGRWKLTNDVNGYLPHAAQLDAGLGRNVTIADL